MPSRVQVIAKAGAVLPATILKFALAIFCFIFLLYIVLDVGGLSIGLAVAGWSIVLGAESVSIWVEIKGWLIKTGVESVTISAVILG